jgi:hypothetical protein
LEEASKGFDIEAMPQLGSLMLAFNIRLMKDKMTMGEVFSFPS